MPRTWWRKPLEKTRGTPVPLPRWKPLKRTRGRPLPLPRLWNAHRRIKTGRSRDPPEGFHALKEQLQCAAQKRIAAKYDETEPPDEDSSWQDLVSPDIVEFIGRVPLSPREHVKILQSPHLFFSRPKNVPLDLRKQILFPNFTVTLYRTPHLPPKYASFSVPLWFNKLDLKSYLSSVYNVKVLHVRSTVLQQRVEREQSVARGLSNRSQGRLKRPMSKKKMTAELLEPFVWPDEIKDLSAWENEAYWASNMEQYQSQKRSRPEAMMEPNLKHRKSIAEQAKELLEGKTQWKPTWQSLSSDATVIEGQKPQQPSVLP